MGGHDARRLLNLSGSGVDSFSKTCAKGKTVRKKHKEAFNFSADLLDVIAHSYLPVRAEVL